MKKILITGATGMLATDFIRECGDIYEIVAYDRQMLDIRNITQIEKICTQEKPNIILNCAAYTDVESAEDIGKKECFDTNTLGVYNLAKITDTLDIDLIIFSSDYVFDGISDVPLSEDTQPNPQNNYGMSKYLAEEITRIENPDSIIVRTSWLYGGGKGFHNFVNTMIALSETQTELSLVDDQYGSPTYAIDLVHALSQLIEKIEEERGNVFHLSGNTPGYGVSWYEFAAEIFTLMEKDVVLVPCLSEVFPRKAKRPKYGKLTNRSTFQMRDWKEGLEDYIARYG